MLHYYRPQRSWDKVMFLLVSVILFTGGRSSASVHARIPPPRSRHPGGRHPPGRRLPWEQIPPFRGRTPMGADSPGSRYPLQEQNPLGADPQEKTSSWEQTPPSRAVHAGRYGQQAGGTHPIRMHSFYLFVTCQWIYSLYIYLVYEHNERAVKHSKSKQEPLNHLPI